MINKLKASIKRRLISEVSEKNPLKFIKLYDPEEYLPTVISIVYLHTRAKKGNNKTIYIAETISSIGHGVRGFYKLKKDSSLAAKLGAFLLYSFEELKMIQVILGQATNGNNGYIVKVINDEAISSLWNKLSFNNIEKLPSLKPHNDWLQAKSESGANLVKTNNKEVLEKLTIETHPMIFNVINRKLKVGWNINKNVYDLSVWALKRKTKAFSDIWDQQNPEAKNTKLRESKAILSIAERFLGKTFYHSYYFDFRGRIYPSSAYLHEQGADLSRGLLTRAKGKLLGREGFEWLLISIASTWGGDAGRPDKLKTDKIPLHERIEWVLENEEMFLSFSEDPKKNQGWMEADKPWQHIAACFDFFRS